jgi:uncharacterized protein YutE (UPF0331/DUF86 family)
MVDEGLILRKISEVEEYLGQVSEYKGILLRDYQNDWKIQRIVERTLQMMIETCVDIAGHIISDQNYRIPASYADTFKVLKENGLLSEHLCQHMEKMVKFRNVIVHQYDRLDAEIVVGILKKDLEDFLSYKMAVIDFIKRERSTTPNEAES